MYLKYIIIFFKQHSFQILIITMVYYIPVHHVIVQLLHL